jgi:short-subunit dehydrogenase
VAAAARLDDVTVLINNAGIGSFGGFLAEGSLDAARAQLETNYFGPLRMSLAFAPVLAANGGGAILNVLSIASWISTPMLAVYGSTKAAEWSLTNGLRHELRAQGTQVLGMHMGFVDTDLTREIDMAKSTPDAVVREALDALERGAEEVLADDITRQVKPGLSAQPPVYLQILER